MAQATIAAHTPTACAGCYGQYPDRVHVDFRSAIEGALVDPANPRGPRVDWVVLCEDCIRCAQALLPEVADERENLRRQVADATQRAEDAENYASRLEDTLAHRPQRAEAPARAPRPRPKPQQRKPRYQAPA